MGRPGSKRLEDAKLKELLAIVIKNLKAHAALRELAMGYRAQMDIGDKHRDK